MNAEQLKRLRPKELLQELSRQIAAAHYMLETMRDDPAISMYLRDDLESGVLCDIGDFRICARFFGE